MELIIYDLNDLKYSAYYIIGFIQFSKRSDISVRITSTLPEILKETERRNDCPAINPFTVIIRVTYNLKTFFIAIDTADRNDALTLNWPVLEKVKYYFKVNYNLEALQLSDKPKIHLKKILPCLPFFPLKPSYIIPVIPSILHLKTSMYNPYKWYKFFRRNKYLKFYQNLRSMKTEYDVYMELYYYDQANAKVCNEERLEVIRRLREDKSINAKVGFIEREKLPPEYAKYQVKKSSKTTYIQNLAKSNIFIYMRGLHNCISFKFGELMSIGRPIVGQPLANNRQELLSYPNMEVQFSYESPVEMLQQIKTLINDENLRDKLAKSNVNTFEKYLSPLHAAMDIISKIKKAENNEN